MIYFNINIRNPRWSKRFQNVIFWSGSTPFKNKFWEIQIFKNDSLLRIEFGFTMNQDHAGLNFGLGLIGYEIDFTIYDNRHWDHERQSWVN